MRSLIFCLVVAAASPSWAQAASPDGAVPEAAEKTAPVAIDVPAATEPLPSVDINTLPPPSMGLSEMAAPLFKTMLMLGVVVALAYLSLHKGLGKLVERQNLGKRVKVIERVGLDSKRSLFLVDVDGEQMLLAGGEGGVVHIRDVAAKATTSTTSDAPPKNVAARFVDALRNRAAGEPPVTTGLAKQSEEA